MNRPFVARASSWAASVLAAGAVGLFAASLPAGCAATPSKSRLTEIVTPSREEFIGSQANGSVSRMLELRCGSLDCHGTLGRPMRIYSREGLRLPVENGSAVSGGTATTVDEMNANFDAVIGIQPEDMSRVAAEQGARPERLLLITKALGNVDGNGAMAHKGGQVFAPGDDGDTCLKTWLASKDVAATDFAACKRAAQTSAL